MLAKITYRDEIKKVLLRAIFKGELKPGNRISLVDIAKQLEVSVTPVREALTQLTETRVINYVPNRGFIVTELSQKEAMEIYEIISSLEATAMKSIEYSQNDIKEIKKAQKKFTNAKSNLQRVLKDMEFHQALIAPCKNELLKKIIEDVRIRVFFYELHYMTNEELKKESDIDHNSIISLIVKGQHSKAAIELQKNWTENIKQILTELT